MANAPFPFTKIPHLGYPRLYRMLTEGDAFLKNFVPRHHPHEWTAKFMQQHKGDVAAAVVAKVGSHQFCKRRPADTSAYRAYVQKRFDAQAPLEFRTVFGPVKNVQRFGDCQRADVAEHLALIQLARVAEAVHAIYPYGVRMEVVPDDLRARHANRVPEECVVQYITSLQDKAQELGLTTWLTVTDGQRELYDRYRVPDFFASAEAALLAARAQPDSDFMPRWEKACCDASQNLPHCHGCGEGDVAGAAWRYMVAYEAEVQSGLWSPVDAFPLQYGRRAGFFQMFTLYKEETAMPWQILLPLPQTVRVVAR